MADQQHQLALERIKLSNPIHFLAVGFGSGLIKVAPGTLGSLVGLVTGVILLKLFSIPFFLLFILFSFALGCYLCKKTSDDMQVHDHGAIVWDEIVAIWLVLTTIPTINLLWVSFAFLLFRFFDIIKPKPIRYFDHKLDNGFGIMFDDLLAAIYTILGLLLLQWLF
ncbi:phosphatidylglycerophosphatase A [Mergibacter septicus]|uniref:phosphatidylglycerophosphatase A family protein n=1 Tax=Mergibacter septicus TaxID=221402 RepID=UPI0011790B0C|nr:phosphatidylglycerophosphatase A [Mergibacter septicus]AWX13370.1 phosphatidylglycerophosphatase A [Mergibacter septicus]